MENDQLGLKDLPRLDSVPQSDRPALFHTKIKLCHAASHGPRDALLHLPTPPQNGHMSQASVPDHGRFQDDERVLKTNTLLELVHFVSAPKQGIFVGNVIPDVVVMVASNIFRTLPSSRKRGIDALGKPSPWMRIGEDTSENDTFMDEEWPHLQIVYEFFLKFIMSKDVDAKAIRQHLTPTFLTNFLELFDSQDAREREYLKTILHRIYGKSMPLRAYIRTSINSLLCTIVYETQFKLNGVNELLEILGSIINGFALPLKLEHKRFLHRVLLPLHKSYSLNTFHQPLSYCVMQFVEKDGALCEAVITSMLRYWPVSNSEKELLFIMELEEMLEMASLEVFTNVVERLFKTIKKSIRSHQFQVSQRALSLWNNEYIAGLISQNREVVLGIIFGALFEASETHWNVTIQTMSYNVLKLFMEIDVHLFEMVADRHQSQLVQEAETTRRRAVAWQKVEQCTKTGLDMDVEEDTDETHLMVSSDATVPAILESEDHYM